MSTKKRRRRKQRLPEEAVEAEISALSSEGRGIAHIEDRTVFIDQALQGERVLFKYTRLNKKIAEGRAVDILQASEQRVEPRCEAFDMCGGCSLQHMSSATQIQLKQTMLLDQLKHNAVIPQQVLDPLLGPEYGYRHKARLGVRYVHKKERVLVGFRERNSSFITETRRCEVLHPSVGEIIDDLADCINRLEAKRNIPQIEVAVGDNQTVLVFRHLEVLPDTDRAMLADFCTSKSLVCYLQAGKPDDLELLVPEQAEALYYRLPVDDDQESSIKIEFQPSDFTQVNPDINKRMVLDTISYLALKETDTVLDLFSGLGNFSLAMAKHCQHVTAVEGSLVMVKKARHNAELNNISNTEFIYADLYNDDALAENWTKQRYDKILLDPPRSGAVQVLPVLRKMQASTIVYVSCHPATLARDAAVLVNELSYKLKSAGIMNMFPHTGHVESIAVFEK
ncbi:MAG: 23S rRNA (uracil(1939)-C(5))-methyltransferase RlmD [Gammaproteobacteria bacterium]|nr:23S rRNA (uracil(1939)-C(5))-methyltransferase RlmD [Gammaproteobacteria bacterium]NNJ49689.1 23S rRNA (uracil(1939)-C(5))-methyltransferase RlmD [Gammaproteobacteria bacterium]